MDKRYVASMAQIFLLICLWLVPALFPPGIAVVQASTAVSDGLPPELDGMTIKESFVPMDAEVIGVVRSMQGRLIIRHGRGFTAYFAAPGDRLYEHDILYTLKGGRTRIRLKSADVITLGDNSRVSLDEFKDNRQTRKKRSVFSVLRGKAMFYAVRLFRYRSMTTEVHTQTAVVGVRGTKFGVKVEKSADAVASARPVYLADASGGTWPGLLAENGTGDGFETTVYGFDGEVAVTSTTDRSTQTVGAGENVVVGAAGGGPVTVTPPVEARQFSSDTEAPPPQASEDGGDADGGGGDTGGGDGAADEEEGDSGGDQAADDPGTDEDGTDGDGDGETAEEAVAEPILTEADTAAADVSQNETAQAIAGEVTSGTQVGYFAALLTGSSGTAPKLADIYINASRNDFAATSVKGTTIVTDASANPTDGYITASGTGAAEESAPYLTRIRTEAGSGTPGTVYDSGDLGTTRQMDNPDLSETSNWPTNDKLGENSYMEWGFWRMSRWVPGNAATPYYAITDRAYYINGVSTPDGAVAGIDGTYAGSAWGTYFSGNGGTDMTGTFNCKVSSNSITNFEIKVYEDFTNQSGRYALITNGTGNFVGSSGEFQITGGTFQLSGGTAVYKSCTGSLFGTNEEHVGGAWAMDAFNGGNAAVGIFVGDKGGTASAPSVPTTLPMVTTPGGGGQ